MNMQINLAQMQFIQEYVMLKLSHSYGRFIQQTG